MNLEINSILPRLGTRR